MIFFIFLPYHHLLNDVFFIIYDGVVLVRPLESKHEADILAILNMNEGNHIFIIFTLNNPRKIKKRQKLKENQLF